VKGVNRVVISALLLGCSLVAPTRGADRDLEIRLSWPGGVAARCGIPLGSSRLVLIGGDGPGGAIGFVVGLDGSFVRAGPLAEAGLLRVAAGPLDFGPGTEVTSETTGLRLDGSFDAQAEASVQVALLPEVLHLFLLRPPGGAAALGGTLGPLCRGALSLDVAAAVSAAGPPVVDTVWFRDGPPTPPGLVLLGTARIRLGLPHVSAAVSAGASAAERAPPGWFAIGTGSLDVGDSGIDLLAAAASAGYLELGGGDDPGGARAGIRLRLAGRAGRFAAKYARTIDPPGFAAGPFRCTVEALDIRIVRRWPSDAGAWELGLSAKNRIETGADGDCEDDPSGRLSVDRDGGGLRAGFVVDVDRDDGVAVEATFGSAEDTPGTSADIEVRCTFHDGPACLGVAGTLRLMLGAGELMARAGVRDAPLVPRGLRAARPWISFALGVSAPDEPAPAARAP
jgi:hypothetical protein